MAEDVTALVIGTLHEKLPDIPVYREKIPSGFTEPSFVVTRGSVSINGEPNGYDRRRYAFDVAYFPNTVRSREDMDNMSEWLISNMRTIEPNYAAVINSELNITDEILHYTFDVRTRVRGDFDELFEQSLDYIGGMKDG